MVKRKLEAMMTPEFARQPLNVWVPMTMTMRNTATTAKAAGGRTRHCPAVLLNASEQKLRRLLLYACKSIDATGDVDEPLVLRWAGGWVRDKLLDKDSNDIDVAINAMTGVAFAQRLADICNSPEVSFRLGLGPGDLGNLHRVSSNPEKSKHLETAMVRVLGLDVDFVNLRRETYVSDTRNPLVEFGTAAEDALRRDATINALFYNIHDDCIEDFTGGLSDLDLRIIRTPLEPLQTFTDDPLRVLRLVRFASRLQFTIDSATENVMDNAVVLDALRIKISRERVGAELEKMLKGNRPCTALRLIDRLNLYHAIFTDPDKTHVAVPKTTRWHVAYTCLQELMDSRNDPESIGALLTRGPRQKNGRKSDLDISDDDKLDDKSDEVYLCWILAAVSPWMAVPDALEHLERGKPPIPQVAAVARQGFKASKKLCELLVASRRHMQEIIGLKTAVCSSQKWTRERDKVGMMIRRWDSQGGAWTLQVLSALLVDAIGNLDTWSGCGEDCQFFLKSWQKFLQHLIEQDVFEAPTIKPLVDGHSLAQSIQVKPGRWMKSALDVCMAWQLRHPEESNAEGAINEVRQRRQELSIPNE